MTFVDHLQMKAQAQIASAKTDKADKPEKKENEQLTAKKAVVKTALYGGVIANSLKKEGTLLSSGKS